MPLRREPLPALTALRFFAALAIFVFHALPFLRGGTAPAMTPGVQHLAAGVTFFFVLSGFILTYNYLDQLRQPTARGVWNFYVARWARIYPVHLLTALAVLPITLQIIRAGVPIDLLTTAVTHALLVQAYLPQTYANVIALNPPSWSLSAEWFFYLCLPLLILGLTTGSRARRAGVVVLALTPWLLALDGTFGWKVLGIDVLPYCSRIPPVRLVDFLAGVLLGIWWHRRGTVAAAPRSVAWATLAEVAAVVGLAAWWWACLRVSANPKWVGSVTWNGVYLPPFLVLIGVFARGGGLLSRVLASRPLVYLGEISYAFYMIHAPIIFAFLLYGLPYGLHVWAWGWQWLATGLATLALSAACYHLFEIPLRNRLRRWLSVRRADAAPVPAAPVEVLPFPAVKPTAEGRAA